MRYWTNKQEAFLAERWAAGDGYAQIADAMAEHGWPALSDTALASKRKRMGLKPRTTRRPVYRSNNGFPSWPEDRTQALRQAVQEVGPRAAARRLRLTVGAVAGKLYRMRMAEERGRHAAL